jgi:hypothetical protein
MRWCRIISRRTSRKTSSIVYHHHSDEYFMEAAPLIEAEPIKEVI